MISWMIGMLLTLLLCIIGVIFAGSLFVLLMALGPIAVGFIAYIFLVVLILGILEEWR